MKNIFLIFGIILFTSNLNSQANLLNAKNPSEIGKKQVDDCTATLDQIKSKSSSSLESANILDKYLVS